MLLTQVNLQMQSPARTVVLRLVGVANSTGHVERAVAVALLYSRDCRAKNGNYESSNWRVKKRFGIHEAAGVARRSGSGDRREWKSE